MRKWNEAGGDEFQRSKRIGILSDNRGLLEVKNKISTKFKLI